MTDRDGKGVKSFRVDNLVVEIHLDREKLGGAAGQEVARKVSQLLLTQKSVNMVFAAAPSQDEFLHVLSSQEGIDWSKVTAFHLDEYLGLSDDAPQSFRRYLRDHIFDLVHPGKVHLLNGMAPSPNEECERYSRLLRENPLDIACIGVGENGHIAFNDPPVADFADSALVKVVELDQRCRLQQVHDGCFESVDQVPTHALTLTVPAIMSAKYVYCMVPGPAKAEAVQRMLEEEISTKCPASILRLHKNAKLYLDMGSAGALNCSDTRSNRQRFDV